jgi:hypothetical protein
MKRSFYGIAMVCAAALSLWPASAAAKSDAARSFVLPAIESFAPPSGAWTGRVVGLPGPLPESGASEKKAAPGLPTFTRSIVARGRSYRYTMVGSDPYAARPARITIPVQIIPVRVELSDGTVLDATDSGPGCAGPGDPLTNTLESPLFTDFDYGEGGRQYVEENRRAEFWALVQAKPNSSVRVAPIVLPTLTLTVNGPSFATPCGRAAIVSLPSLDKFIRGTLFPVIKKLGVSPKTFPLLLFSNVYFGVSKDFIAAGYHSSFNFGGIQTYGVAEYDTTHTNPHSSDITVLSHELAEWYDDPFVNNATPAWGHIGQVEGCQGNLEVGDPLTGEGVDFEIPMPNGLTYHPQELAFFSWFYNQSPSLGLDGMYSWGGTLTSPAAPCN